MLPEVLFGGTHLKVPSLLLTQVLFTALTGGEVRKLSMLDLGNPFSAAWKNARRAKKTVTDYNWKVSSPWPESLVFSLCI